jgi:hypothetical protein
VASGTEALLIAMMALDLKPGDEVITTPFTFAATVETIVLLGCKPVFVDIEPDTCNVDASLIEAKVTAKTRAIMPVSLYGQVADMAAINAVATRHGLAVIKRSCALSTFGATSFFPSKPLGCYGDGGALFTDDDTLAQAAREIRVHGQSQRYRHTRVGVGGRMDTLQCAVLLAKLADENPLWRLPELAGELENIAQNKRRILGFGEDASGFKAIPGVVTVTTIHGAKGLEWDRVYLTGLNTYGFPGGGPDDQYRSERWYVRDRLNLNAEAEAQLRQLHMGTLDDYVEGRATEQARLDLAAERLRLFYVGITRARRELILTYNTGRRHEQTPLPPAAALEALAGYLATQPKPATPA